MWSRLPLLLLSLLFGGRSVSVSDDHDYTSTVSLERSGLQHGLALNNLRLSIPLRRTIVPFDEGLQSSTVCTAVSV